jgi:hypothetical protein
MPTDAKLEGELFELEKKFWQAMKDRDVATAVALTDFPCVVSGPQGVSEVDEPTFTKLM